MEKTLKIDLRQREALVSLLSAARNEEEERLKEQTGITEQVVTMEIAKQKGCEPILKEMRMHDERIKTLKAQLEDEEEKINILDQKIKHLGFDREKDGSLSTHWGVPATRRAVKERLEEAFAPVEKSLKKYSSAIARVWAAVSPDDLQKAVEGLV